MSSQSDNDNSSSDSEYYNENSLYVLNTDVIAIIVEYLTDPRDIVSLWNSNKWLFCNIMSFVVKKFYIDPRCPVYVSLNIIDRFPRLKSIRCDVRVNTINNLIYIITKYNHIEEIYLLIS